MKDSSSCSPSSGCCTPTRRDFLRFTSISTAALNKATAAITANKVPKPAAFTAGCTIETQKFAEKADEFKAAGATLVGLTAGAKMADDKMASAADNLARLAEFSKEHCRDKFPMVAINADTVKAYDVVLTGRPDWSNRTSFVIAPDGKILLSHTDMAPDSHIAETLKAVKAWKTAHAAGKHTGH